MNTFTPETISHREVIRLTEELALYTGESATEAILTALRERLAREQGRKPPKPTLAEQLIQLGQECVALPVRDTRSPEEIVGYNEYGVPA